MKKRNKEKEIYEFYKYKGNITLALIRKSKADYYAIFFEENKSDTKKLGRAFVK